MRSRRANLPNTHTLPKRHVPTNVLRGLLRFRIKPGRILILLPVDFERVVTRDALPRTRRVRGAGPEVFHVERLRGEVRVAFDFDPQAELVLVDKIQIQQVIFNLVRNAIEAMQETTQRELTISTAAKPGGMVEIDVTDTGPGIAPEIAPQLFQPFLTTKPTGMGVGLSISRTIVEAHGGRLWAEPNPHGGATFRMMLKAPNMEEITNGS